MRRRVKTSKSEKGFMVWNLTKFNLMGKRDFFNDLHATIPAVSRRIPVVMWIVLSLPQTVVMCAFAEFLTVLQSEVWRFPEALSLPVTEHEKVNRVEVNYLPVMCPPGARNQSAALIVL
jgi:hypothetical protein